MKKTIIFLIFVCFSATVFAFSGAPAPDKVRNFTLKDLSGNDVSLDSYKGKVVLIVFFATWCPSCQDEMPKLESICERYKASKFEVLAVNIKENANSVRAFADDNKLSFPVLLDSKGGVANTFKVRYIPRIFILSKAGEIVFTSHYLQAEDLEKEVKKAIK